MINWQSANIVICLAAATLALYLGQYARQHRSVQGASWFGALAFACGWALAWHAFQAAAANNLAAYLTFTKLGYAGLAFIPVAWLAFALQFGGQGWWLKPGTVAALLLIPLITLALIWTNEWHGLIWSPPRIDAGAPLLFASTTAAALWIFAFYAGLLVLAGSLALARLALRWWRQQRLPAAAILVGSTLPWLLGGLEILHVDPVPGLYLHVVILALALAYLALALFRLRLLDIMPLARNQILNGIPDGVIVLDRLNRVVMINDHVRPYLDQPSANPAGLPVEKVFPKFTDHIAATRHITRMTSIRQVGDQMIQFKIAPILDPRGQLRGRLFVLSDVTMQALVEKAVLDQYTFTELLHEIANLLSSTLDTNRVLSLIVESVGRVVPNDRADIMLLEGDGCTVYVRQHAPYTTESNALLERIRFDYRQVPALAEAVHGPLVIPDTAAFPGWSAGMEAGLPARSVACAPIRVDGSLVGFIHIVNQTPNQFKPEAGDRLLVFADQAALAIKNAQLYEQSRYHAGELQRRVDSLTILQRLYKDIGFSFQVDNLLEISLDAAMRLCRADGGYIALAQGGALRVTRCYGDYPPDALDALVAGQRGILAPAVHERRPLMVGGDTPIFSALPGAQAQIALPLLTGGADGEETVCGVIVLETRRQDRFTDDRFQLLLLLSARVASALENAGLVAAVQSRAEELEVLYQRVSGLEHLKSDMIRIAAHDLKNPLHVLRGYIDQMSSEEPDLPVGRYSRIFSAMQRAADRMQQIIQDILSLERIERMAEEQNAQPFDLRDGVQQAAELADRAAAKNQQFDIEVPGEACIVRGDAAQMAEAITNLVSNAIKYTPDGGRVTVRLDSETGLARFEVRDTGIGIPAEQQARLFEPFYRVKTRETAKIDGTGLGLHLAKKIVERHGGRLVFHSVYGQGSTFGFELPLAEPSLEPAA